MKNKLLISAFLILNSLAISTPAFSGNETRCGTEQSKRMVGQLVKKDLDKSKFEHANLKTKVSAVRTVRKDRNTFKCVASIETTSRLDNEKNFRMTAQVEYTISLSDDLEDIFATMEGMYGFDSWVDGNKMQ